MTSANRVCYLLPVHNDQAGVDVSLRSISAEHAAADIVVVDDGSCKPIAIRREFQSEERRKIAVLRLPQNHGITHALNVGLEYILARNYSYVARLDATDTVAD